MEHHHDATLCYFGGAFNLTSLVTLPDMGMERCVRLDGLTEADINKKLEELAKAAGALKP